MEIIDVKCGMNYTLLLTSKATIYVFGKNDHGQLGVDDPFVYKPTLCKSLIAEPIVAIAVGENHSLALTATGLLMGTGSNLYGQLCSSNTKSLFSFIPIDSMGDNKIAKITACSNSSAAIDSSGSLYVWGGQFGPNSRVFFMENASFVNVSLGSDGQIAATTVFGDVYVSGYIMGNGHRMEHLVHLHCYSPRYTISCGDYFLIYSDRFVSETIASINI
jgi:alpha-tubulin suppressor-like RCC1 family protein